MRAHRQRHQTIEDIRIATDVPARLETDLVVYHANRVHTLEVGIVELPGEQPLPVRRLGLLEAGDPFAQQQLESRDSGDMLVEPFEQFRQPRLQERPKPPE